MNAATKDMLQGAGVIALATIIALTVLAIF
jgi:hypothetical protein